jgi:hypothetical protein
MKEVSELALMKRGRYKGKQYKDVPLPYRQWLDVKTANIEQVIECDLPVGGRRLSAFADWELKELLENQELTLWEHEVIKDYIAIPHKSAS